MPASSLPCSAACERNKQPILEALRPLLGSAPRRVLEIGSGTGQHVVHFAAALPATTWQPTERQDQLDVLRRRIELEGSANVLPPLSLDLRCDAAPPGHWGALYTANTLHIVAPELVRALFALAADALPRPGCLLIVYGPFRYGGAFTTASNAAFDASLRERDPASGLRDFEWVDSLARAAGFVLLADRAMPANNQLLAWRRAGEPGSPPAGA